MSGPAFAMPDSLEETLGLLTDRPDDAVAVAGGTSLVILMKQQLIRPMLLVGLGGLSELRGIENTADGGLSIGAFTTHRAIETSPSVADYSPGLAHAFGEIATVRIRNQATLGGNLAHADPAQDPPPVLLAHDASVVVAGLDSRREIPMSSFFVDFFETALRPGELITRIVLPPRPRGSRAGYVKYLPRTQDDYATVSIAASAHIDAYGRWHSVRIGIGSGGPVPMRALLAEAALEGLQPGPSDLAVAADLVGEAVDPIDDLRGSASYKRRMAGVWTRRALQRLLEPASEVSQ
jgi:carbon-monoxide dehydrogenase medium subunit